MNNMYTKLAVIIFAFFTSICAFATDVIKTNVGIGYLDVSGNTASFNLTLQELDSDFLPDYPYRQYATECTYGGVSGVVTLSLDNNSTSARLFAVLLTAKQGQNYVDVTYDAAGTTGSPGACTLKAITIKYKQN